MDPRFLVALFLLVVAMGASPEALGQSQGHEESLSVWSQSWLGVPLAPMVLFAVVTVMFLLLIYRRARSHVPIVEPPEGAGKDLLHIHFARGETNGEEFRVRNNSRETE